MLFSSMSVQGASFIRRQSIREFHTWWHLGQFRWRHHNIAMISPWGATLRKCRQVWNHPIICRSDMDMATLFSAISSSMSPPKLERHYLTVLDIFLIFHSNMQGYRRWYGVALLVMRNTIDIIAKCERVQGWHGEKICRYRRRHLQMSLPPLTNIASDIWKCRPRYLQISSIKTSPGVNTA